MTIVLRPMVLEDLDEVCALEVQSHLSPWSMQAFKDSIEAGVRATVLLLDGELVAYSLMLKGAPDWELLNVTVAPNFRGRGFSKQLLLDGIEQAKHHQADSVFLEVRQSNLIAIACYQSLGFSKIAVRKQYYAIDKRGQREDAWVMQLNLIVQT